MRTEKDALGELQLPDDAYYGVQTERARRNFDLPGPTTDDYPLYIKAVAAIKKAAAMAHAELGVLGQEEAGAIGRAADEVMEGRFAGQFPLNMLQGGGGTSTNMNVNEVIANRANEILTGQKGYERVHPNDHVNMGQSTNDVIPSAVKLCAYWYLEALTAGAKHFGDALEERQRAFENVVKLGRTCLQDALPVTLGQEFSGYVCLVRRREKALRAVQGQCLHLPMGATAVGTGAGSFAGYQKKMFAHLAGITGLDVRAEENLFDGLQNGDGYLEVMQAVKALAVGASKIATDLRLLGCGPRAGLNELELPAVQPGSSIMPGKVNPVMPEVVNQIAYQVCGCELAVAMAVEGGELDLNVWEPVILRNICDAAALLGKGLVLFADRCVAGLRPNEEVCRRYAEGSLSISSVLSALFGHEVGVKAAKKAHAEGKNIAQVAVELGLLSGPEAVELLDPRLMTDAGKMAKRLSDFRK